MLDSPLTCPCLAGLIRRLPAYTAAVGSDALLENSLGHAGHKLYTHPSTRAFGIANRFFSGEVSTNAC